LEWVECHVKAELVGQRKLKVRASIVNGVIALEFEKLPLVYPT